jgi:hypothetical protein
MSHSTTQPSIAIPVVEAVADATGVDPTALRPLAEVLDTDALDALCDAGRPSRLAIEFAYEGRLVQIETDEEVTVTTQPLGE